MCSISRTWGGIPLRATTPWPKPHLRSIAGVEQVTTSASLQARMQCCQFSRGLCSGLCKRTKSEEGSAERRSSSRSTTTPIPALRRNLIELTMR